MEQDVFERNWELQYTSQQVQYALQDMTNMIVGSSDQKHPLVLVLLLKGGLWTGYNILNLITTMFSGYFVDIRIGHMGLSSYGDQKVPGDVKVVHTLDLDVKDLEESTIWIIDDIWDTGNTMKTACDRVRRMGGTDLNTGVLVYRCGGQVQTPPNGPNVYGFKYEGEEFFAGCGMGIGEQHRYHPELYIEKSK